MKRIAVLSVLMLMLGLAGVAQASFWDVDTIDDFAYYNLQLSGTNPIIENFENDQINTPGLSVSATGVDQGIFTLGYYQNVVDDATGSTQTFTYTTALNGFGGWFDLANPGGAGCSIDVLFDGVFVFNIPNTAVGEFFGYFSDTPFTTITLIDGGGSGQETYQIVDMALCPVPVPPSALLLGSCLMGLVGFRLRKK